MNEPLHPLRILHVSQPVEAGVANHVAALARDQVGRGWRVTVASPQGGSLSELAQGCGAAWARWEATRNPGPSLLSETKKLNALITRERPDLIHLHSSKAGLAGRITAPRAPLIFQPNAWSFEALGGPLGRAAQLWERFAARRGTILCVSRSEKQRGLASGIPGPYEVIPNGVDLDRFRPATPDERAMLRANLDLPGGPLILSIGRLSKQKGQDLLLDAWGTGIRDAHLALLGEGPMRDALKARADGRVLFPGNSSEVELWLRAADLFVLPSRWEGMSFALLEAIASGLPCVAFDVAGAAEAIGEAGVIAPLGDVRALREALETRVADPRLRAAEGEAARARALEFFDIRRTCDATAALYADLLEAR